jgi:IS1 family transposase
MYTLSMQEKVTVVTALTEGNSIRSFERMTGIHRDTIMRLLVATGNSCAVLMDRTMRELHCRRVQCDEIWTYVGKKAKHVRQGESVELGDQWVFVALDADTKLIPAFLVGKRSSENTQAFIGDVYRRVAGRIPLTTDAFIFYRKAVEEHFGADVDYAQLTKLYGDYGQHGNERYSPSPMVEVISNVRQGNPDPKHVSTSFIERSNLTMRMQMRRFTRLTNAFSKKLENLKAAIALHFAHYNFCRVHSSLRVTPSMAAGISSSIWSVQDLISEGFSN